MPKPAGQNSIRHDSNHNRRRTGQLGQLERGRLPARKSRCGPTRGGGGDARAHLTDHGEREGRRLFTREFIEGRQDRDRRKHARFAPSLDPAAGAAGTFRSLAGGDTFPLAYGTGHHDISAYDSESGNPGLGEFIQALATNPDKNFLDIGCGFRPILYENCLYLDVYPSLTADIIMEPACTYPIASASMDGISCLAVLEHVEQPWVVVREIHRILKPGGIAYIDWPFLQPVHGYPSHFYNATRAGLETMFKDGFEVLTLETFSNQTPDHTATWLLREWIATLTSDAARAEFMGMSVGFLLSQPPGGPFWSRILAATPPKAVMTFACGNTLIARKT